jgi:hypothetical protein
LSTKTFRRLENDRSAGQPVESVLSKTAFFHAENLLHDRGVHPAAQSFSIAENEHSKEDEEESLETHGNIKQNNSQEDMMTSIMEIDHESKEEIVEEGETHLSHINAKCSCSRRPFICRNTSHQKELSAAIKGEKSSNVEFGLSLSFVACTSQSSTSEECINSIHRVNVFHLLMTFFTTT